jgi:hypothetical protein
MDLTADKGKSAISRLKGGSEATNPASTDEAFFEVRFQEVIRRVCSGDHFMY